MAATNAAKRPKLCLVCSHGGHLNEMLELLPAFEGCDVFYFCYDAETTRALDQAYLVPNMARNPIELMKNLWRFYVICRRERPDAIVSTGAEIALPAAFAGKLLFGCRLCYVECGAQVEHASGTGRILYWLADAFYVQWPELLQAYGPKAQYVGSLIDSEEPA